MLTEKRLINKIKRKQDKEAANILLTSYYKELYAYVYIQTSDEELAKDLTQDIFIQVLQKITAFDEHKASFRTWLYKIASNKICDYYRSKAHHSISMEKHIDMMEENPRVLTDENLNLEIRDLSELIVKKELVKEIMEIVSNYKYDWQAIFLAKCFQEMTFREIADMLNISENTVKSRFYKMIRQIKSEVDKE